MNLHHGGAGLNGSLAGSSNLYTVTSMGLPPSAMVSTAVMPTDAAGIASAGLPASALVPGSSSGVTGGSEKKGKKFLSKEEKKRKKKLLRTAGGEKWEDPSLAEWDPADFRLFCGDLGNDVTDDVLTRTFNKYPSFQKAKVVRDKRSNKSKGYGFVSFKDPQDFMRAMREMNGKYVGSRPIKLKKSNWKDRNVDVVKRKEKTKARLGLL